MRHLNFYLVGSILFSGACMGRSSIDTLAANVGGAKSFGGAKSTGGSRSTGGMKSAGGSTSFARTSTGGTPSTGGTASTGGTKATGGMTATGGTPSTGGSTNTKLVAKSITVGGKHTCALLSGGSVQCWGDNESDQLGNGTTAVNSSVPVPVSGTTNATAVAAGDWHTCTMLSGGTVQCWGLNAFGQLGNGTADSPYDTPTPVTVVGITNAIAVAAGSENTCAVLSGGTVQCWGDNSRGELGNGTMLDSSGASDCHGNLQRRRCCRR